MYNYGDASGGNDGDGEKGRVGFTPPAMHRDALRSIEPSTYLHLFLCTMHLYIEVSENKREHHLLTVVGVVVVVAKWWESGGEDDFCM